MYLVDDDPQDNKASEAVVGARIKDEQKFELSISDTGGISGHVSCFGCRMKQNMTEVPIPFTAQKLGLRLQIDISVVHRTTTTLRNLPTRRRLMQLETNPTRQEQRNNREKQSTQYLMRFGNVPTSSGQGRERFY